MTNDHSIFADLGRVAVIGSGAVGAYYGGRLAQAGADVHFLVRRDHALWKSSGLRVQSVDGDFTVNPVQAYDSAKSIGPCDVVIIALKTTANPVLVDMVPPLLKPGTRLLTLQNGLGNDAFLAREFGPERVMGGLCFVCINRSDDGVIHHLGQGHISLGNFQRVVDSRLQSVADAFNSAGVAAKAVDDLAAIQWRKLVWNIPFNGLALAEGGIDCAGILATPEGEARVRRLMAEVISAAAVFGHQLPDDIIDQQISVTQSMGAYRPSTLIDFLEGRPVELEGIWGEPLRQATAVGLAMPELSNLYQRIRKAIGV